MTSKLLWAQGHPTSNLTKTLLGYIHGISLCPMQLIFVELSCLQEKIANFDVEIDHHDLEIFFRSRSSIFKVNQDTLRTHPWYKFGPNATNICWVILLTSENCKFSCWNRLPWPRKIGQSHPSSNLTKTLMRHPWYKFGPNAANICWVIVFTRKNCKFSCWNRPPWPRNFGAFKVIHLQT